MLSFGVWENAACKMAPQSLRRRRARMIGTITRAAHRLDLWLQLKLGRPYNLVLAVGLVIEIVRGLSQLPHELAERTRILGIIVVAVMEVALLIHQVGALSHHFGARREGRGRGHLRKEPAPAALPPGPETHPKPDHRLSPD